MRREFFGQAQRRGGVLVVLGHGGFFRRFPASFDYHRAKVKVWPKGLYRG